MRKLENSIKRSKPSKDAAETARGGGGRRTAAKRRLVSQRGDAPPNGDPGKDARGEGRGGEVQEEAGRGREGSASVDGEYLRDSRFSLL